MDKKRRNMGYLKVPKDYKRDYGKHTEYDMNWIMSTVKSTGK